MKRGLEDAKWDGLRRHVVGMRVIKVLNNTSKE
jgi:hypothetical protein